MLSHSEVIDRLGSPNVLVIGDLILDLYVEGRAERVSPEAPVLVFQSGRSSLRLGGAGNVAANVVSAGGHATCLGLVGDDVRARQLQDLVEEAGISSEGLVIDEDRPTTVKTRFVSGTHQVLRVDEESRAEVGTEACAHACPFLEARMSAFDAVILSDYGKGALAPALIKQAVALARAKGIPILVDPKGLDFSKYAGATLITPNKAEAEAATGMRIGGDEELRAVRGASSRSRRSTASS
ncbi:MAG: PfkB family carbohydrate kinase [Planctomycetota bacterium]